MYSEQSSKVNGPDLSLNFKGKGRNATQWREGGRNSPYAPRLKYTPADPDASGKWSHDLFGQQVQGGNLAFRLAGDPRLSSAEAKIAARNGGKGGAAGGQDLMDPQFNLLGRVQPPVEARAPRPKQEAAPPPRQGGKAISIMGKSKPWVLVANLVAGTTAEDVKTTFNQFGEIVTARMAPAPRDTVSVLLQFEQQAAAQEAISTFHAQIADGRPISVTFHQPAPAAPSRDAPAPSSAPNGPRATALGSRIAGGPSAARAAPSGGLFERLGLAAIAPPARRSAPPPVRGGRGAMNAPEEGGDLMDMFNDSKMRSETLDVPTQSGRRSGGGRGRGARRGGAGSLASRVRGVGGMDVD